MFALKMMFSLLLSVVVLYLLAVSQKEDAQYCWKQQMMVNAHIVHYMSLR